MTLLEGNEPRVAAVITNVALLAAYLTLNCTLNLLNKWSLGIYGELPSSISS
jgi:hypothetical protein